MNASAAHVPATPPAGGASWRLKLLYDGLCPVCAWEMRLLRRRDRSGALDFDDIAAPGFDPSKYGLTMPALVGAMHGITPDGRVLIGPDVFIEAYRLVGKRWLAGILSFRPTRPLVNLGYRIFARYRPRFSSFDPSAACAGDRCKVWADRVTSPDRAADSPRRSARDFPGSVR